MKRDQMEIPGTEQPKIKEIENAAEEYVSIRDKRIGLTKKECESRDKLIEVVKANKNKLTPNGDGEIHYRYGEDMVVILRPGKDKVKVKHDTGDDDDDEE